MPEIRLVAQDTVDPVFFEIELIVALLVGQHQDDQHAHRHSRSQPGDIDKGEYLVLQDVPEPGLEIVEKHTQRIGGEKIIRPE